MSVSGTERNDEVAALPISEATRRLIAVLGPTLVATLAGSKLRSAPREWAKHNGPTPDPAAAERLRFGYEQCRRVSASEGDGVARAWFIGGNPWLGDSTAVTAIREGRFEEVSIAVQAQLDDSFDE
ncbi:hypothetical protein ACI7YT_09050 [Microbacterium sp. M]|uniref:hypothetical protein n=1 Tax=Microbacterium sp. M TaxID=3377125 RepID=UPI00386B53F1